MKELINKLATRMGGPAMNKDCYPAFEVALGKFKGNIQFKTEKSLF